MKTLPQDVVEKLVEIGLIDIVDKDGNVIETKQCEITDIKRSISVGGKEYPNPVPQEIPVGYRTPETFHDQVLRILGDVAFRRKLVSDKEETIEEFLDLSDPEELDDPLTRYETQSMVDEIPIDVVEGDKPLTQPNNDTLTDIDKPVNEKVTDNQDG